MTYRIPIPLGHAHILDDFECGSTEQTDWLRRFARQSASMGTTRVFVVTEAGSDRVVAYYAWCMAQLAVGDAPQRLRKGAGGIRNRSPSWRGWGLISPTEGEV